MQRDQTTRIVIRVLLAVALLITAVASIGILQLQRGISLDQAALGSVRVEGLTLHLDGKLKLAIKQLELDPGSTDDAAAPLHFDPDRLRSVLRGIRWAARAFSHIDVDQLSAGTMHGNFRYHDTDAGYLRLQSPEVDVDIRLSPEQSRLIVQIAHAEASHFGLRAEGTLTLDIPADQLIGHLELTLADLLPVSLNVAADSEQLAFSGRGLQTIDRIAPVVELFRLGPVITPWIADYLRGEDFTLEELHGSIPFDDPKAILQTLYAKLHANHVAYTFAQGVDPILADEAEVVFERGVLNIYPKRGTFYGHDGGSSHLNIDFTDSRFPLTAYIVTRAEASDGIDTLLGHYGIPFPIRQVAGLTDVDLTLRIELNPLKVHANGRFRASQSAFLVEGQRFEIDELDVGLQDSRVAVHRLDVGRPGLFAAGVSGSVDAGAHAGSLDITMREAGARLGGTALALISPASDPVVIRYLLSPQGDRVEIPATRWRYGQRRIALEAVDTPFDIGTLSAEVPPTDITVGRWLHARVSGNVGRQVGFADLNVALLRLERNYLRLSKRPASVALHIGKRVHITTDAPIRFAYKGAPLEIAPSEFSYANGQLHIERSGVKATAGFSSRIRGDLNLAAGSGELLLHALRFTNRAGATLLELPGDLPLGFSKHPEGWSMSAATLALQFIGSRDGSWSLESADLARLAPHSPFLRSHGVSNGRFRLSSTAESPRFDFSGALRYPYALLVVADTPVDTYDFDGWSEGGQIHLDINDAVQVALGRSAQIRSEGVGFNLPALLHLIRSGRADHGQDAAGGTDPSAKSGQLPRINLIAQNAFVWLDEHHRLLADSLSVHYARGIATAILQHGAGLAHLELQDNALHLAGQNFNQTFMAGLLEQFTRIEGGNLDFRITGDGEKYETVAGISDTVLRDYKHLNNMLAFIDTLPGLLTFRPPHYDRKGLPVTELAVAASLAQGRFDIKSLRLESPELTLHGSGELDLRHQTTDMTFNVVTGAKKHMQKIPVLGYILSGDEQQASLTLQVKGDLHDPQVKNSAAKNVATYPFQVLKRTLLLPAHFAQKLSEQ